MDQTDKEKELLEEISVEFEYLKDTRSQFETDWKDAENYFCSSIYDWTGGDRKPTRPTRYTSRPSHYLATLVSGLMGYTISPNIVWMKLSLSNRDLMKQAYVKDWLELVERIMYSKFAQSNLYSEAPTFIRNAAVFGHGVMLIDEDPGQKAIRYSTRQPPEIFLDVNEFDHVDTVYRLYAMTVRNAVNYFGYDAMHPTIQRQFDESAGKNAPVTILHAVYPRKNREEGKLDNKNAPFASVYVDWDNKHLIEEKGYWDNPYATFIWNRLPRTGYGTSPAQDALPDVMLLNRAEEARLRVAQRAADPAYNVPDDMRGAESVIPGGFNYYTKPDQIITPINIGANFPITIQVTQDIESRVRDWCFVDFFLMLQANEKNRTATEVVELQGEKAAVLSSLIVNQNNALSAIIRRTFNILARQGELPPVPSILKGSGAQLDIDFIGPLAQAQKKYHQSGGVAASLQFANAIFNLTPEAKDYVNGDVLLTNVFDTNGFPQDAIREEEEVTAIRKARAQAAAQAQQQQMALAQQQAILPNLDKMNQAVAPGSMLSDLDQQLAGGLKR